MEQGEVLFECAQTPQRQIGAATDAKRGEQRAADRGGIDRLVGEPGAASVAPPVNSILKLDPVQ